MVEINIPEVVAEVEKAFARYERALVTNDVAELDAPFWKSPTLCATGRPRTSTDMTRSPPFARAPPANLARDLIRTVITTYGRDLTPANAEFKRICFDTDRTAKPGLAPADDAGVSPPYVSLSAKSVSGLSVNIAYAGPANPSTGLFADRPLCPGRLAARRSAGRPTARGGLRPAESRIAPEASAASISVSVRTAGP